MEIHDICGILNLTKMRLNLIKCGVLSGHVSFDEFLVGIKGVMNSRRKAIVLVAFDILDKDGSGEFFCANPEQLQELQNSIA